MPHELPKAYDPTAIEDRWAKYWVDEKLFHVATPSADSQQPIFTILLPPPNVTGRLHMGHMLNQTEMDILTRWHRMKGDLALWLPGTDHAGIATQMMVERQLAAENVDASGKQSSSGTQIRRDMGREAFQARVWQWKEQYGGAILDQMKRLGASVDWSREYFTMDDGLSQAVREAFVRLYEEGLIYRGAYIVNWCPRCMTAISDLEVVHEETKGSLWKIRYPILTLAGEPSGEFITVATTRPETMLGDTAIAVNPNDPRYTELLKRGTKLRLPLVGRELPLIADDYANPEFGTGAVKVTPAHDPNDYQIGLRHNLPQINIFDDEARVIAEGPYKGLDRYQARKRILADLEAAGQLAGVKDHNLSIGKCDRCKTVIEPRLSTQWFIATGKPSKDGLPSMKELSLAAVRDGHIKITPEQYKTIYLNWMDGLYDWCISRQLWWGHRIPAWHCSQCEKITVARETPQQCAHCGSAELMQDPDVLDTWFSSALLPFSAFGWPDKARERSWGLDPFYPTSLLVTGFDILFFWVARMIMMGTHFMIQQPLPQTSENCHPERDEGPRVLPASAQTRVPHPEPERSEGEGWESAKRPLADSVPFKEVYIHALVRDADRQKMSKTKGNVLDPIDIIQRYGTDAVRFTLASQASPGTDIAFNEQRTEGYRAFANKIWNATRFLFMNVDRAEEAGIFKLAQFASMQEKDLANARQLLEVRWIRSRFTRTAQSVNAELANYRFDEAARLIYQFFWGDFCDWFIESMKPLLNFDDAARQPLAVECLSVTLQVMERALCLLAPFMPFITEEIWHTIYDSKPPAKSIALVPFPQFDPTWIDEAAERDMQNLQDIVTSFRESRVRLKVTPLQRPAAEIHVSSNIRDLVLTNREFIRRFANLGDLHFKGAPNFTYESIAVVDADGKTLSEALPTDPDVVSISTRLLIEIDPTVERTRLEKEIAKLEKELEGKQKQLSSEDYLAKAPVHIIDGLRKRADEIITLLKKNREGLNRLR